MNKLIHIATITEVEIVDLFLAKDERTLLDKIENYLSNEVKFNTKEEVKDYFEKTYDYLYVNFHEELVDLDELT